MFGKAPAGVLQLLRHIQAVATNESDEVARPPPFTTHIPSFFHP